MPLDSNAFAAFYDGQIPQETDPVSGLPIGPVLADGKPAALPEKKVFQGRYCRLEPFDPDRHAEQLFAASTPPDAHGKFLYLPEYPPKTPRETHDWMTTAARSDDPLYFVVIDKRTGRVEGRQTLMRIAAANQSIEIGNIYWGPEIAGTRVTTEANFLFAQYAFDELGYRRYEWKCNALNAPSRQAALRFGFRYEGHFRRAVIVKGRTRDTSWFSIIRDEWPALRKAYETWLDPDNFDDRGNQKSRLSELTAALT